MGLEISRDSFDPADYLAFSEKLAANLRALSQLLDRPGFGTGPATVGAELELHLVDAHGRPMPINRAVLADTLDGRVTLEVDRFNLEINSRPCLLAGHPFRALEAELSEALGEVHRAARSHGARVATIGILPTLEESDLQSGALTELHRYRALSASIRRLRQGPTTIRITGLEELEVAAEDVTMEGANTSLQLHLRVAPRDFARTYNAAQLATGVALAVSGNSPFFLGKRLWQETRIALFRQAIDERTDPRDDDWRPARVSFGHGWARSGARELFEEAVALHEPLLPVVGPEDAESMLREGRVPALEELRLHQGTVWRWNRPVYDHAEGGHLRIELRALPSGPTVSDMTANAAYLVGLTLGLAPDMDEHAVRMTFGQARRNFYEAARHGLDAELLWPERRGPSPRRERAQDLALDLLPLARRGLLDAGVDGAEIADKLAVIEARIRSGRTGARWQSECYDALRLAHPSPEALKRMLEAYLTLSREGRPVHEWPLSTV